MDRLSGGGLARGRAGRRPRACPHGLRPDLLGDDDHERHFWWAERWIWTIVFGLAALAAFGAVTYLGTPQGWPRSAATLNALAAAVVVGIGDVFVVHARAPRR